MKRLAFILLGPLLFGSIRKGHEAMFSRNVFLHSFGIILVYARFVSAVTVIGTRRSVFQYSTDSGPDIFFQRCHQWPAYRL